LYAFCGQSVAFFDERFFVMSVPLSVSLWEGSGCGGPVRIQVGHARLGMMVEKR
jgi:hypothetical protein